MNLPGTTASSLESNQGRSVPPLLQCFRLPAFESGSLENVLQAFEHAAPCPLHQAWLAKEAEDFAPAFVRIGWRESSLLVFAELTDADIHSRATEHGQRLWELGDAFELFLKSDEQDSYVEFHISPNNLRLQLRFAGRDAVERIRSGASLDEVVMKGEAFDSRTWVQPDSKRWCVFAEIPASSVCDQTKPLAGRQWRFSFSRYDYTRGKSEPVISSTSPHPKADFHRTQEWGMIQFQNQNINL